jgi:glycosyltransferase involved in cell wall biosynthesis
VNNSKAGRFTPSSHNHSGSIDVIVLTRNSERTIGKCLQSIRAQMPFAEIIIVDAGSTDRTLNIVAKCPNTRIIKNVIGRGNGRAVALEHAKSAILVWVDSDIILGQKWWSHMQREFSNDLDMVFGRVENADKSSFWSKIWDIVYQFASWHRRPTFETNNMVIWRDVLVEVGGWDKQLIALEDMDLRVRMQKAEKRIEFVPGSVAFHYHRTSLRGIMKQFFEWGYVYHIFRIKYGEKFPWLRTLAFPVTSARVAIWGIVCKRDFGALLAGTTYFLARLSWLDGYRKGNMATILE